MTLEPEASALAELETGDALKAQIVLLRYFTGLTMDRHWSYIRAWLMKRLSK